MSAPPHHTNITTNHTAPCQSQHHHNAPPSILPPFHPSLPIRPNNLPSYHSSSSHTHDNAKRLTHTTAPPAHLLHHHHHSILTTPSTHHHCTHHTYTFHPLHTTAA
eukprot:4738216-Alexandrium_andersonii.AAC.1